MRKLVPVPTSIGSQLKNPSENVNYAFTNPLNDGFRHWVITSDPNFQPNQQRHFAPIAILPCIINKISLLEHADFVLIRVSVMLIIGKGGVVLTRVEYNPRNM